MSLEGFPKLVVDRLISIEIAFFELEFEKVKGFTEGGRLGAV